MNNLLYNDSVSQPEFPQHNAQPFNELRPRDEVFDNIIDNFSFIHRRTEQALKLARSVFDPEMHIEDTIILPVRQQFMKDPKMTVNKTYNELMDRYKLTNMGAKDIYRPIQYDNIGDDQSLTPPINLDDYRLPKNTE